MKVLVIGRALPEPRTGMFGIFEYSQSNALSDYIDSTYLYCDLRSIKRQKLVRKYHNKTNNHYIYGFNLPIGGLPHFVTTNIRTLIIKHLLKEVVANEGIPDIVHVHFPLLTITEPILNQIKNLGCKLVITEHWSKVQNRTLIQPQISSLRKVVELADVVICVGEDLKQSIIEYVKPLNPKKLVVIPNMVEKLFHYSPIKNNQEFTFLFAGRLELIKRVDFLIQAFEIAFPDKRERVRLLIYGDGSQSNSIKRDIIEFKDTDRIKLCGNASRTEMFHAYESCDCYVSASALETFGVPFAESWVVGRPIICSSNSSIRQYVREGDNGLFFEENNIESLAEALKNARCNSFSPAENIAADAENLFSEKVVAEKICEVYSSL